MYPDEAAAVADYNARRDEASLRKASDVRFAHAVRLLNAYYATGNQDLFEHALAYTDAILDHDPAHENTHLLLGTLAFRVALDGGPSAAVAEEHLQVVIENNPGHRQARQLLAHAVLAQGFYDRALGEFEYLLREDASFINSESIVVMCMAYERDEQQDRGMRFFAELARNHPQNADLQMGLAMMLQQEGRQAQASALLARISGNPQAAPELQEVARAMLADLEGEEGRP